MIKASKKYIKGIIISQISGWGFTWGGIYDNRNGEWWLASQISILIIQILIFMIRASKIGFNIKIGSLIICTVLILIGTLYSIISLLNLGNSLTPLPEPKQGAKLITSGLYRNCRHPLYRSLIFLSSGIFLYSLDLLNLILLISLCIILIGKAKLEEKKLKLIHSNYNKYMYVTPAIFPRIPLLDWRN